METPDRMHDVAVAGAGPAGLYAALLLARQGLDVVVLEEHETVGCPVHCTGVLAREAFDEFDLAHDSVLNELTTVRFISPSGRDIVYRTAAVEAVVIDRALFDAQLAEDARRAGAELIGGARVTALKQERDFVSVERIGHRSVQARACVLACGARYGLHRALGLEVPSLFLHTAQRELPAEQHGDVELHFGSDIAPGGFAWAVPVWRGHKRFVRVGVMSEDGAPRYFQRMVDRIGPQWRIQASVDCRPHQKILPLTTISRTYGNRMLFVGDAAGLVKPTTGGGIYYSLLSAAIAAEVLSEALASDHLDASALMQYERRWRARLESELEAQLSLRTLAQRMSDQDIENLFELARIDGVMPIVQRTAAFNRHRKLILALFRHPPVRQILFRSLMC